jgi:hypothetical protein
MLAPIAGERADEGQGLEILRFDAGWRNCHFLKLTTDEGVVGWSGFDKGFGSPSGSSDSRCSTTSRSKPSCIASPGRPRAA